jgi:glycosyltransferase involved in cell wall biosynthesis
MTVIVETRDTASKHPQQLVIALVAPPWEPVSASSPDRIGRSVDALAAALTRRGHQVHLIAPSGSTGAATVHEIDQPFDVHEVGRQCFEIDYASRAVAEVMRLNRSNKSLDVVHDHCGMAIVAQADFIPVPLVHTMRGQLSRPLSQLYAGYADKVSLVATSPRQLAEASPTMQLAAIISDPVDLTGWSLQTTTDGGVLWLWGYEPLQGAGELITLIKDANVPLTLAGPILRGQERWFDAEIAPHLSSHVRYLGSLDGPTRNDAVSRARALLVLGGHYEAHHADIVHALACGKPVVVGRTGEHDVVHHGVNGYLADDDQAVVTALQETDRVDPRVCRESALSGFDADVLAARYETLYRSLAGRRAPGRSDPLLRESVRNLAAIHWRSRTKNPTR